MVVLISGVLLAAVVGLNFFATAKVTRSHIYSKTQKSWQIIFVWMIPLIGSIIVLSVLHSFQAEPRKSVQPAIGEEWVLPGQGDSGSDHGHSDSSGGGHS